MPPIDDAARSQHHALTAACGWADLTGRTQLTIAGADRATFLHNLCTADIRRLPVGQGCEAFFTNVQGKTLGHGFVYAWADELCYDTVAGQASRLLPHCEKYHLHERVEIVDRTDDVAVLHVAGPGASAVLQAVLGDAPPAGLGVAAIEREGLALQVRGSRWTGGEGWQVVVPAVDKPRLVERLAAAGAIECGAAAVEIARLEAGTPCYGVDLTEKNLPQEVNRDALAISFTKGCYLGQETVARIDALGHVNRLLVGVRFGGDATPAAGLELQHAGQTVGAVTSAAWSPRLEAPLALAYVRRGHDSPGARFDSPLGAAEVIAFPGAT